MEKMTSSANRSTDAIAGLDVVPAQGSAGKTGPVSWQMLVDLLTVYDIVAMVTCGLLAHYLYFIVYQGVDTSPLEYVGLMLMATVLFQFVGRQHGLYSFRKIESFTSLLFSSIYTSAVTFAIVAVILFFLKASQLYSRIWFAEWALLLVLSLAAGRGILASEFSRLARTGALRRSVALVGAGVQFASVKEQLQRDQRYFCLTAELEFSGAARDDPERGLKRFIEAARTGDVDEVLIAFPGSQTGLLELVVQQTQTLAADIHILPDFGDTKLPLTRLRQAGEFVFITAYSKPIEGWGAFLKKLEDYTLATICLFLMLPAMLVIAAAIKLDSKGPVFFRQRRHGYNHRVIDVLKFRTMTVTEDGDTVVQATKDDKRVTRVGYILRRTSLDEVPQLINVLRGEMSFVGPRPHAMAHNTYYGDIVENYSNRHRVKPGITGWAQVHGYRGETDHPSKMAERVRYDLEYIDNWSIWLDLKIILMTPLFGLFRGAY
jgi:putative colanic acid biosynthesis UDP-glucose lipid carrier transferase